MDRAGEGIAAGGQGRHVVGLGGHPGEDLALEHLGPAGGALMDRDVVGRAGVLVLELDLERLPRRGGDRGLLVRDALGRDLDRRASGTAAWCRTAGCRTAGCRTAGCRTAGCRAAGCRATTGSRSARRYTARRR